jgi:death-on-curing protein
VSDWIYLEVEEIVEIHAQMLDLFGGRPGFKDLGGVESAATRPRNKAHYEGADLLAQAAALYYGLAKNHGFTDGNKRVAVVATDAFLQLNGWEFVCPNAVVQAFTQGCDADGWTEEHVEAFVRANTAPVAPDLPDT